MSYSIICNARRGHNSGIKVLGLVDRAKCRSLWWTSDNPFLLLSYDSKSAAEFACSRLKRNSPRIVSTHIAEQTLRTQANEIDISSDEEDLSWDAHKDSF